MLLYFIKCYFLFLEARHLGASKNANADALDGILQAW